MIDHYEELFSISAEVMDDVYTVMMDTYPQHLDSLCEGYAEKQLIEKRLVRAQVIYFV